MMPRYFHALLLLASLVHSLPGLAEQTGTVEEVLGRVTDSVHTLIIATATSEVKEYEIGLGAIKKVRGVWGFKGSQRVDGLLQSYTWQVLNGFTSSEVMADLLADLKLGEQAELLFSCDGRACGQSAQWANRIFNQRVLYGREDLQQYRVYSLQEDSEYRLVVYSASRTTERQYLHAELVRLAD